MGVLDAVAYDISYTLICVQIAWKSAEIRRFSSPQLFKRLVNYFHRRGVRLRRSVEIVQSRNYTDCER